MVSYAKNSRQPCDTPQRATRSFTDAAIVEAAQLAAAHSQARNADKVPVDYTTVKNVKKPNGAKPGMVIYFEQQTLYVTPKDLPEIEPVTEG